MADGRPDTLLVDASGDADETYAAVLAAIWTSTPREQRDHSTWCVIGNSVEGPQLARACSRARAKTATSRARAAGSQATYATARGARVDHLSRRRPSAGAVAGRVQDHEVERLVEGGGSLTKRVLLPGFREDVLSLMKSADLFVMSSVTEGLGSAVLDAMAMGQPVVGTIAGGIPEAVLPGETGELVEPGDAKPLAAAIVKLLKNPDLRRAYGDAGRQRVAEQFGVDRLVAGTLACYRRFANQSANSA